MQSRLRIAAFVGDCGGCYTYRIRMPLDSLSPRVIWQPFSFLPTSINNPDSFNLLVNLVASFDLVIVQRNYILSIVDRIRQACELVGTAWCFETDDDYLSIAPSNPCYFALSDPHIFNKFNDYQIKAQHAFNSGDKVKGSEFVKRAQELVPTLMESRKQGIENYKQILRMAPAVTVSTQELADTIYPYNKNVHVFENKVQFAFPWRLDAPESAFIQEIDGQKQVQIHNRLGLWTVPKYAVIENTIRRIKSQEVRKTPRVGYSVSASHWGEDWDTIRNGVNKVAKRLFNKAWYLFLGDSDGRFRSSIVEDPGRALSIPGGEYNMYLQNISNFDIGLSPLAPTSFNLAKSDIKLKEYASWGVCGLAPAFRTYQRNFKDNDTAMFYRNEKEFCEKLELLITNSRVREEIGHNALKYIINNHLSWLPQNTEPRYDFYVNLVNGTPRLKIFKPMGAAAS